MKSLLFTLLSFCSLTLLGQHWVDLMQDHSENFYEVQNAFNEEWEGKEYERGKGWKQYKRWEYFMEQRTYPSGERLSGQLLYNEWINAVRESNSLEKTDNEWEPIGPTEWSSQGWNPGLGRVNSVVEDPNDPNTIYVATPSGGLWKSTDAGDSWIPLTDNLPAIGASGLAIDPNDSNILYLATGDGNGNDTYSIGAMKSTDGGVTWETTGLSFLINDTSQIRCSKILMDPSDSQRLWLATHDGLYTTTNGGENWTQTIDDVVRDIEVMPSDPSVVYVCGRRFYKSENSGESFTQITSGIPSDTLVNRMTIAVTPANADYVYILASSAENSGFYGLYRSTDAGENFNLMSNSPNILTYSEIGDGEGGQGWYDLALAASPNDEDEIYTGGINVWKSSDGGSTWEIKSHWIHPSNIGYTHADIHILEYYGNTLYCGSDGGVFKYLENSDSWQDLSEGLQISQYYRIAVSTSNPELVLAASQDNGTNLFNENGEYVHLLGGDGNAAAIDYTNDDIMYSAYPGGVFQKSTNGGNSFEGFTSGLTETGAWVTPLEMHPQTPSTLFAGYENVWKNTNGTWFPISNLPTSGTLFSLKVANSDPDVIYAGGDGFIYRTLNGGESWTSITSNLPDRVVTGIEVDPENPLRVWVTISGYLEGNKVFYRDSEDDTWTNISQNLPNVPANCITYQVGTNDGLYIGTDIGVYFKDAESILWTYYNEGLPNVIVNQIILQYTAQKVIIGTYGRGVWQNDFFNLGEILPIANFTGEPNLICEGETVNFTNQSLYVSDSVKWTFPGGTPDESTEINPTITYNEPGIHDVKLWVANINGPDSLLIEDYIEVIPQQGVPAPYSEPFEDVTSLHEAKWYINNQNDDQITWELNTELGYESSQSAWIDNYSNTSVGSEFLESSTIDLTALDTAIITMRVAYAKKSDSSLERIRVSVSSDCGENWSYKDQFTSSNELPSTEPTDEPFIPESSEDWNLLVINNIEPEERTENFRVQLEFRSNGGNNIYVDDINIIEELPLSSVDQRLLRNSLNLFPNPVLSGQSTFVDIQLESNSDVRIEVYDIQGKRLSVQFDGTLSQGSHQLELDTSGLASGIYTIRVATDALVSTGKLIITEE